MLDNLIEWLVLLASIELCCWLTGFDWSVDRAGRAQQTGAFDKEIVPVTTKLTDKDGNEQTVTVSPDRGVN